MSAIPRRASRVLVLAGAAAVIAAAAWWAWHVLPVSRSDVTFRSGSLTLAGTLYRPRFAERPPAVVLIHGSGPATRSDMAWFAERFARHGVAALAYDKRGVGESEGDTTAWRRYDFGDLAADAAAGVHFLRDRGDLDTAAIGLFGTSQGGWVAPLAAARLGGVAFLIALSASVATVGEDNLFERSARLRSEGFTATEVAEAEAMHLVDQEVSRSGTRFDEFAELWDRHRDSRWFRRVYAGDAPSAPDSDYRRWYRTVVDFDPVPILASLDVPTLWLFGDPALDRFGPVTMSLERVRGLAAAGKAYAIHVYAGADHNLRRADGGREPWLDDLWAWLDSTVAVAGRDG